MPNCRLSSKGIGIYTMLNSEFFLKIKIILLPFMVLTAGVMYIYTVTCWFTFDYLRLIAISPLVKYFLLPAVISSAGIYKFMRKRFNTLDLESGIKLEFRFSYFILPVLVIAIPTGLLQYHIDKKYGKLTVLSSVSEISQQQDSKYYVFKKYFADKHHLNSHKDVDISKNGKNGTWKSFYLIPLRDSATVVADYTCHVFLALKQEAAFDATLNDDEKHKSFNQFYDNCIRYIDSIDLQSFSYFENISHDDGIGQYRSALNYITKNTVRYPIILEGIRTPFAKRSVDFEELIILTMVMLNSVLIVLVFASDISDSGMASYRLWKNIPDTNKYL